MITKDLLIVGGYNAISIINVNQYKLVKVIPVPYSNASYAFCILNENMFLTGSEELRTIYQWKIEGDNIILIGKKRYIHDNSIYSIENLGNGHIATGSKDQSIK
jgi:WD40 repeat protein